MNLRDVQVIKIGCYNNQAEFWLRYPDKVIQITIINNLLGKPNENISQRKFEIVDVSSDTLLYNGSVPDMKPMFKSYIALLFGKGIKLC